MAGTTPASSPWQASGAGGSAQRSVQSADRLNLMQDSSDAKVRITLPMSDNIQHVAPLRCSPELEPLTLAFRKI